MQKRFVDILRAKFKNMTGLEIEQAVLLAELETSIAPLAWSIAYRRLIKEQRKLARIDRIFASFHDVPDIEKLGYQDLMLEQIDEEDEWKATLAKLSAKARKLAKLAKYEAERFENVPGGVWTRHNLYELRRRVKRDFLQWEFNHSTRAYYEARTELVAAFRRNRENGKPRT